MTQLRDLWVDLVDKRLWPVAAVLIAGLVAIPLVLAKPAPKPPATKPVAASAPVAPPDGAAAAIADVSGTAYFGPVSGSIKDPFKPQPVNAPASPGAVGGAVSSVASAPAGSGASSATGGSTGSSGASGSSGSSGSGSSGSGSSGSGSSGSGSSGSGSSGSGGGVVVKPIPAVPGSRPTAVAALEFGLLGGDASDRRVAELTPLPSPTSPAVVYLGQTKKGESAFLVSSDVTPRGQGHCLPDLRTCSTLVLAPGQVEYLTVATTAGRDVRYRLKFVKRLAA